MPVDLMVAESLEIKLAETYKSMSLPASSSRPNFDCPIELNKTTYLSQFFRQ